MDNSIDRLSILHDNLLMRILSFLSSKEAIQTCVLARRWRNTWDSVPVLTFNLDEFLANSSDLNNNEKRKACENNFQQFVNKMLGVVENREHPYLNEFHYNWKNRTRSRLDNSSEASMAWLNRVARLKPQVITVFIYKKNVFYVPDLIFSCESLQELVLSLYGHKLRTVLRPQLIDLPSLKVLELSNISLDDDFARKLFLGCPSLQSLHLGSCNLGFPHISSNALKTLAVKDCAQLDQMQICCPSLVSLEVASTHQMQISLENTASLANVDITLKTAEVLFYGNRNILGGLSNVTTLKLDLLRGDLKDKLEKYISKCINFKSLRTLELGRLNVRKDSSIIAFFLQRSPHLRRIIFNLSALGRPSEGDPEEPIQDAGEVSRREYLESVKIIKWGRYNIKEWDTNDQLLQNMIGLLQAHIITIGEIVTT